jgi:hypothetical protein
MALAAQYFAILKAWLASQPVRGVVVVFRDSENAKPAALTVRLAVD